RRQRRVESRHQMGATSWGCFSVVQVLQTWSRSQVNVPSSAEPGYPAIRAVVISAESVQPLRQIVPALPARSGFALVVACTAEHSAAATLRSVSALPIVEVRERAQLEPDRVFVIPAGCDGAFHRGE